MLHPLCPLSFIFFFFNDTATTEIYTLSLHDALPISLTADGQAFCWGYDVNGALGGPGKRSAVPSAVVTDLRSEEHTSELQSQSNLVCRLLLEKKKKKGIEERPGLRAVVRHNRRTDSH